VPSIITLASLGLLDPEVSECNTGRLSQSFIDEAVKPTLIDCDRAAYR